jgi:hypothetical protein
VICSVKVISFLSTTHTLSLSQPTDSPNRSTGLMVENESPPLQRSATDVPLHGVPRIFIKNIYCITFILCHSETWTLNTQQANKLLATEMDFWRRSARKSRKEKVRNDTITEIIEVGKNTLEVTEEKRLRWFGHVKRMPVNRLPQKNLEWEPEGTRRRVRPKERWIYGIRRSMINHGLREEDTRDRDRW